jgi:hypothetical protein
MHNLWLNCISPIRQLIFAIKAYSFYRNYHDSLQFMVWGKQIHPTKEQIMKLKMRTTTPTHTTKFNQWKDIILSKGNAFLATIVHFILNVI